MGMVPETLPGYQPQTLNQENRVADLWKNCSQGAIKMLLIAGEDPCRSSNVASKVRAGLQTVPFLVVQDMYMTETARMADIILPTCSYAEKEGTFTNMSRHVQRVASAVLPEGQARPDFEIFADLAQALDKPFVHTSVREVQKKLRLRLPVTKEHSPVKNRRSGFRRNREATPSLLWSVTEPLKRLRKIIQ